MTVVAEGREWRGDALLHPPLILGRVATTDNPEDERPFTAMCVFDVEALTDSSEGVHSIGGVASLRVDGKDASLLPGGDQEGTFAFILKRAAGKATQDLLSVKRRLQERGAAQDRALVGELLADLTLVLLRMGQFDGAASTALRLVEHNRWVQSPVPVLDSLAERIQSLGAFVAEALGFLSQLPGQQPLGTRDDRYRVADEFRRLGKLLENGDRLSKFADQIAKY